MATNEKLSDFTHYRFTVCFILKAWNSPITHHHTSILYLGQMTEMHNNECKHCYSTSDRFCIFKVQVNTYMLTTGGS